MTEPGAGSRAAICAAHAAALRLLATVAGDDGLAAAEAEAMSRWRRLIPGREDVWIVPVWHLTFIERCAVPDTLYRLRADPDEAPRVAELASHLAAARTGEDAR